MTQDELGEEWALIEAAKKNAARFGILYERYFPEVYRFLFQRTADEHLAADLAQDTFFKALQNLSRYQNHQVPFKAWLFVIARNEVNQFFRDKKRPVLVDTSDLLDLVEGADAGFQEESRDLIPVLLQALARLEPEKLELLEWFHFEKRSFQEIADILNARQMLEPARVSRNEISANTIKVRTKRIRDKVAQIMHDILSTTP